MALFIYTFLSHGNQTKLILLPDQSVDILSGPQICASVHSLCSEFPGPLPQGLEKNRHGHVAPGICGLQMIAWTNSHQSHVRSLHL